MGLLEALHLPQPKGHAGAAAKRPAAAAHDAQHGAPVAKLNQNNYGALLVAIENESENRKHPKPGLDTGDFAPGDLVVQHRVMLHNLHTAIILVKTDPAHALKLWEQTVPGLRAEVAKAASAGVPSAAVATSLGELDELDKTIFVPAAYYAAERDAEGESTLEDPDTAQFAAKLKQAEGELLSANELFESSVKVADGIGNLGAFKKPGQVKEIMELVMLPGTVAEKLKEAKKRGIATTTAQLISKVYGSTGALIKTVGEVGEAAVDAQKAIVLARGASKATTESVEKLEKLATKFKRYAEIGKTIGKLASAAAIIADGFKLVTALRSGDFSGAGDALVDMAIDAAPLVAGESAGVALTGIVFLVKTEIAAISMAAEFIRYCKDETVRQAAESFINQCDVIAKSARQLVADCDVIINASNPGVQDMALRKANQEAAVVSKGIRALSSHVTSKGKDAIGGYPNVVAALGKPALLAMAVTFGPEDGGVLAVAQQIADVFHGANAMATYVKQHYTN